MNPAEDEPLTAEAPTEVTPIPASRERNDVGYRIGPFVFVPEWTTLKPGQGTDPWAHRKGEPRLMTLGWTIYLLIASAVTIFTTRGAGLVRPIQYQTAARRMFMLMIVGACILWPLVRLSQAAPDPRIPGERRTGLSLFLDLIGLSFPAAAVLLPLPILTGWGWSLMLAVWCVIVGWSMVCLSVAAWGVGTSEGTNTSALRRLCATAIVLALVMGVSAGHAWLTATGAVPAWTVPAEGIDAPTLHSGWWWALSPISHTLRLTTPPSGMATMAKPEDWRAVVALWACGGASALWVARRLGR